MLKAEIDFTEQELNALQDISLRTGKSQEQLIREAVDHFIAEFQNKDRKSLMQRARGMWKERQDLPNLEDLRREWDRF
jgi:hypothetical protein